MKLKISKVTNEKINDNDKNKKKDLLNVVITN